MNLIALRFPWYGRGRRYFEGGPGHLLMYVLGRFQVIRAVMAWIHGCGRAKALPYMATLPTVVEQVDVDAAVRQIRCEGLFSGLQLRDNTMKELLTFSSIAPCYGDGKDEFPLDRGGSTSGARRFKLGRYKRSIGSCASLQAVAADPQLLAIARGYLQAEPVLLCARMWWSFAGPDDPQEQREAGQDFHYDIDGFRALAFFFYLTDVGDADGPHVYVRGSHRQKPLRYVLSIFKARTDEQIERYYGRGRQVTLCGPMGFGFAEDIFGFHKGAAPANRDRLVLQLRYGLHDYGTGHQD